MADPNKLTPLTPDEVRSRAVAFLTMRKVVVAGGTDLLTGTITWSRGGCLIPVAIIVTAWLVSGVATLMSFGVLGFVTGPIAVLVTIIAIGLYLFFLRKQQGTDTISVQIARVEGGTLVTAVGGGRSGPSIAHDLLRSLPGLTGDLVQVGERSAAADPRSAGDSATIAGDNPTANSSVAPVALGDPLDPYRVEPPAPIVPSEAPGSATPQQSVATTSIAANVVAALPRGLIGDPSTPTTTKLVVGSRAVGKRLAGVDRRWWAAGAVAIAVVVLAFVGLSFFNSPSNQLQGIVDAVANRQAPSGLEDVATFAQGLGIATAPAGITFAVEDWRVTAGAAPMTYQATWRLLAAGNGQSTSQAFDVVFTRVGDTFQAPVGLSPIDVRSLVASVASDAAAQALADSTNQADAAFGITVQLNQQTTLDPSAPTPPPIAVPDSNLLVGQTAPIVGKEGSPAQLAQTYLIVGGQQYLVRQVPVAAVPASVTTGTLDPSKLTGPAAVALQGFLAAKDAGNVAQASQYLVNATGLTASGLAHSTITAADLSGLSPAGDEGAYNVVAQDQTSIVHAPDGAWRIDYTGQPLVDVVPTPGSWTGHTTIYSGQYQVTASFEPAPVTISSPGPTTTVTLTVTATPEQNAGIGGSDLWFWSLVVVPVDGPTETVGRAQMADTSTGAGPLSVTLPKDGSLCVLDDATATPCTLSFTAPPSGIKSITLATVWFSGEPEIYSIRNPDHTETWK